MLSVGLERGCRLGLDCQPLEAGVHPGAEALSQRATQHGPGEDLCRTVNLQILRDNGSEAVDGSLCDVQRNSTEVCVAIMDLSEHSNTVEASSVDIDPEVCGSAAPIPEER